MACWARSRAHCGHRAGIPFPLTRIYRRVPHRGWLTGYSEVAPGRILSCAALQGQKTWTRPTRGRQRRAPRGQGSSSGQLEGWRPEAPMMGSTARSSSAPGSDVLTPTRLKTVRARTGELPSADKWIVSIHSITSDCASAPSRSRLGCRCGAARVSERSGTWRSHQWRCVWRACCSRRRIWGVRQVAFGGNRVGRQEATASRAGVQIDGESWTPGLQRPSLLCLAGKCCSCHRIDRSVQSMTCFTSRIP
jgi:hypothetical protein